MMADLLDDPAAKLQIDRLDGDLRAIDTNIVVVRGHLSRLRAALAVSAKSATEAELAQYREVANTLQSIRGSVARAQLAIAKCNSLCAETEVAAAEEKTPPADHDKQMAALIGSADSETRELIKQIAKLREQTSALPKDPNLPRLAEALGKSAEALQKTIAVCHAAMPAHEAGSAKPE
jgi:multidrug resistance efflux pump